MQRPYFYTCWNRINPNAKKSIGLDPSFGSSKFGIVATQLVDGKIQVIRAEEYDRPDFTDMISEVWKLKQQYGQSELLQD